MLRPLRQSLALRLGLLYALLFAAGAAGLFAALYWLLAGSLEVRERSAVEQRTRAYAELYNQGGPAALRARLDTEEESPEVRSLFVRVIGAGGDTTFARVPANWVETQTRLILVPDGWGGWTTQDPRSVRVPRDAAKDFAIASQLLADGRLLQVARSTDSRAVLLAPLRQAFATIGAGILLVAGLIGGLLAWRATQPLRQVVATARRILETGDLAARVPAPAGTGELAELVRQLNTVLDRNARLIRAQRDTLDNVAHDLRTPLTRLRGAAEAAAQATPDPAAREALADCIEESDRALTLLHTVMDVTAAETGAMPLARERVALPALLAEVVDLYGVIAEEKRLALTTAFAPGCEITGDPVRLRQVFANLLDNALKYTPEGGAVRLACTEEGEAVIVRISDSGMGIPPAEQPRIWERLYRGDQSRSQRGLGLGLSLVKAIVEAHHGTVAVTSAAGAGAEFIVSLQRKTAA